MFVYHSSNVKIGVLRVGSYVTPDAEISKTFGRSKPGKIHYCHEFEAEVRDYSIVNIGGRTIIDVTAKPVGQLERSPTPTGEDWENYVTTSDRGNARNGILVREPTLEPPGTKQHCSRRGRF